MSVSYSVGILLPMFVMYIKDYKCVSFNNPQPKYLNQNNVFSACGSNNCQSRVGLCRLAINVPDNFATILNVKVTDGDYYEGTCVKMSERPHYCNCEASVLIGDLVNKLYITGSNTYGICIAEKDTPFWKDFKYKDPIYNDGYGIDRTKSSVDPYMGYIFSLWFCPAFDTNGDISTLDINNIYNWLDDIINKQKLSVPIPEIKIDNDIQTYIRDSTLIYSIQNQFYNQIYQQGPYSTSSNNDFIQIDPIKDYVTYKNTIILYYSSFISLYATSAEYPAGLKKLLNGSEMLAFPTPKYDQTNKEYLLDIKITYSQYRDHILNNNDDAINLYLNNLLRNFFQDTFINVIKNSTNIGSSNNVEVKYVQSDIFTMYSSGFEIFYINTLPDTSSLIVNNVNRLLNIKITVKIIKWSNMSLAYFVNNYNGSDDAINNICNNTTNPDSLSNCNSIPIKCLDYTNKPNEYKQNIENFCNISFRYDNKVGKSLNSIFLSDTSNTCYCYNSRIAPALDKNGGNKDAMCFNRYCDDDMKASFNLTDSNCKSSCDQVYYWMTNNNPADQPLNKTDINWSEFSNTCGTSYNYTPFQSTYFNKNVAITFIFISILLTGVIFLICKHKKYNQLITFIIVFIVFACMMSLSGFMSHYLSGKSMCDGKKLVCSNSRNVNIPQEFCKDIFNCECNFTQDCASGCNCISSTCYPDNGSRKTRTVNVKKPQKLLIILSIICLLTFPLIFYFLYKDYHLNINKKIVIPVIIVLTLIPLVYAIIISNIKYDKKIYEDSCQNIPSSSCTENSQCTGNNFCDKTSGKCTNCDDICDYENCVLNSCGKPCPCKEGKTCYNSKCTNCYEGCDYTSEFKCINPNNCGGICGCKNGKLCSGMSCVINSEVFYYNEKDFDFETAKNIKYLVKGVPLQIATYDQIYDACLNGLTICAYGWGEQKSSVGNKYSVNAKNVNGCSGDITKFDFTVTQGAPNEKLGVFLYGPKRPELFGKVIKIAKWSDSKWSRWD